MKKDINFFGTNIIFVNLIDYIYKGFNKFMIIYDSNIKVKFEYIIFSLKFMNVLVYIIIFLIYA